MLLSCSCCVPLSFFTNFVYLARFALVNFVRCLARVRTNKLGRRCARMHVLSTRAPIQFLYRSPVHDDTRVVLARKPQANGMLESMHVPVHGNDRNHILGSVVLSRPSETLDFYTVHLCMPSRYVWTEAKTCGFRSVSTKAGLIWCLRACMKPQIRLLLQQDRPSTSSCSADSRTRPRVVEVGW